MSKQSSQVAALAVVDALLAVLFLYFGQVAKMEYHWTAGALLLSVCGLVQVLTLIHRIATADEP